MNKVLPMAIMFVFTALPLSAQESESLFDFNGDRFLAGTKPVHDIEGVADLFMAGETVRSQRPITGSAHIAGRKIVVRGAVGGDAYLAGADISLDGPVGGDAIVSGYNVNVGAVAGDLIIAGANLTLSGPVSGYALIAGDDVRIESVISGDVNLAAQDIDFADSARIEGTLTIYEEQVGDVEVPAQVVPEDRIERRDISTWTEADLDLKILDDRNPFIEFLSGVIIVSIIALVIATIAPSKLTELRGTILERPYRTLWFGILAESVFVGSTIILIVTVIGWVLVPAIVAIAVAVPFVGYVVAAYALGARLLMATGQSEPNSIGTRALAAGLGALAAAVIGLIPFIGWLCVVGLSLAGVGSFAIWLFKPQFYSSAKPSQ